MHRSECCCLDAKSFFRRSVADEIRLQLIECSPEHPREISEVSFSVGRNVDNRTHLVNPLRWMENRGDWLEKLGRQYGRYRRPEGAYGMTTDNELQFLETYARDRFSGNGRIVDLGCWFGATTISLARGLASNDRATTNRLVEAMDLFTWESWMDPFVQQLSLPNRPTAGSSFYDDVLELLRPFAGLVRVEQVDLLNYRPDTAPIEFLFVDAMKCWPLSDAIVSRFFPLVLPGDGYVVQQDFAYYFPEMATNHLVMWHLRDCFEWVHHVKNSCSVVFRCIAPVDVASLTALAPDRFTDDDIDQAYEYSARCVHRDMRVFVEVAKLNFLIEQGRHEAGDRQLTRLARSTMKLEPGMLTSVEDVAAKAAAAGKISDWRLDIDLWIASMRRHIGV